MVWLILFELIVLFALFFWLPVMRPESFFAVHVSREYFAQQGKIVLRNYRTGLVAIFILHVTGLLLLGDPPLKVVFQVGFIFSQLFLFIGLHSFFYLQVRPHRLIVHAAKTIAALQPRKLSDYSHVVIEAILISLILLTIFALAYFYPQLPEMIPVHWNFAGKPDRWEARSWVKIMVLPVLALWLQGLLLITKNSFLQTKIKLPAQQTAAYFALKEKSLQLSMRFIDVLRLAVGMVITVVSLNVIISTIPAYKFLEPVSSFALWTCSGLMMFVSIFFIYRTMRINTELDELAGADAEFSASSEVGWFGGGTIYYNPQDPALFVEKKIGIGNTINFANKQAKYFLLYLLGGGGLLLFFAIANF